MWPRRRLASFAGSVYTLFVFADRKRRRFRPGSDVDVLVEFEPGHVVGLRIIDIEDELSELLGGRRVDLVSVMGFAIPSRGAIKHAVAAGPQRKGTS